MTQDTIVDIPENRVKFFGAHGKMLLPSPATVETLLMKISEKKLITTNLICKELTREFKVQGTCPVTTKKALQALLDNPSSTLPYWRVLKTNGELITSFSKSAKDQGSRLQQEGFKIDSKGKVPKVQNFKESLVQFG